MKKIKIVSMLILALVAMLVASGAYSADLSFNDILNFSGSSMWAVLPLVALTSDKGDNLAGVRKAYVIPVEDITTFPDLDNDKTTLLLDFVLVATKKWIPMYSTANKGTLTFSKEGERDFESFSIGGSVFYPSTNANAMKMSNALLGRDVIILIEENSDNGFYICVGTTRIPARLNPSGDWGTTINGEKGITFEIETWSKYTPALYSGEIVLV